MGRVEPSESIRDWSDMLWGLWQTGSVADSPSDKFAPTTREQGYAIQALLEESGCSEDAIKQVIIAGAFGTYIDVASAVAIGMLPSLPLERFRQAGNAAGTGARLALISLSKRAEAQAIASRVKYVELGSAPKFDKTFIQASYLGRYRIIDGNREEID